MIIDCHANVGRPEHQPPEFLEEMLQPFFRASGKKLPASVYEGTEPEAMMEEYRRAGVDKVFIYGVSPRESQVFWARPRHASRGAPHVPTDNVYVDTSFWTILELPQMILLQLLRCPGYGCTYDRILWGTDYPLTTPAESLRLFKEELPAAAERMGLPMIADEALDRPHPRWQRCSYLRPRIGSSVSDDRARP